MKKNTSLTYKFNKLLKNTSKKNKKNKTKQTTSQIQINLSKI